MRRTSATAALLLTLGTVACGHDPDPKVATAGSGAPKAGATTSAGGDASALKFSQCMRKQGLTWFPDPGPDGGLRVHTPPGADQDKIDRAEEACKAYDPGTNQSGTISAADLDKLRRRAQCIRDHGFLKWPDPDANGTTQVDSKTSGSEPDNPAFQKAMRECEKYGPPRKRR